jgi:hypothetical protein
VIEFFLTEDSSAVNIVDQVACVCGDVCMGAISVLHCEKQLKDGSMDNTNLPCSF